jgi:hypothetical protein
MLDIYEELKALTAALDSNGVPYALCGGLAMAVYGLTRATVDIDFLVPSESLDAAISAAHDRGFTICAAPMSFAGGAVKIRRISKTDPESADLLMLDFLIVTAALAEVWRTRCAVEWEAGNLWVVSREGLIALKKLRGSGSDLDDIAHLKEHSDEA